jgi:predicted transcriptional regulator
MLSSVAVLAYEGVSTFGLGITAACTSTAWTRDRAVAADCGLAPMMLRRHFTRRWGITPQAYRHRFSQLAG